MSSEQQDKRFYRGKSYRQFRGFVKGFLDMFSQSFANGAETAVEVRQLSLPSEAVPQPLSTVKQLLLKIDPPSGPKKFPGLWTVAGHIAQCAQVSEEEMPIELLRGVTPDYTLWLKARRYTASSINTFQYHLRRLLAFADEYCSTEEVSKLRQQWARIQAALDGNSKAPKSIPTFAISKSLAPMNFTEEDLERWGGWMLRRGRKLRTVRMLKWQFRRTIINAKLEHLLPSLTCHPSAPRYAVERDEMPAELQSELTTLLQWKQARFARGRPRGGKHRPGSSKLLEQYVRRLYGFAVNVARLGQFNSMEELFSERVVTAFVDWAMNERELSRSSLSRLSLIAAAIKNHPNYEGIDLTWFDGLMAELPLDDEEARRKRKRAKFVPHEVLVGIPAKIRIAANREKDAVRKAWYAHDELLVLWLTTLPWRQENLRECRIGVGEEPNVFFGPIPPLVHIAKPAWVQERLKANTQQSFWQFHFKEDETKTGRSVRGFLPRRLVGPLETYLQNHRPVICGKSDPGTLFLNREGGTLTRQLMTDLVGQLTFQYAGTQMTPHLFRDAFAYAWLDSHPEDYLSLSKALWHVSLEYTLRIYGRDFDESNGACRVDAWFADSK